MTRHSGGLRWNLWLPAAALLAAGLMIALALTTERSLGERNQLALEGRLLGVAYSAELRLRETGTGDAEQVLAELLPDGGSEVLGLVLMDSSAETVAVVGEVSSPRTRSIDLFLGRFARNGAEARRGPPGRPSGRGRGRFTLQIHLDSGAGALPLVARLLVPATVLLGIALVWLATLGGRFLVRQGLEIRETAERRRLGSLARAGAGLAHQLRTPLATIKGTCQLMAEQLERQDPPALQPRLEALIAQADRMDRLLGRLLDYARPPRPEPQPVPLAEATAEVIERHPGVSAEIPDDAIALVDPVHLVEIIENLVSNAISASPEGETVSIVVQEDRQGVSVVVSDRGPGPGNDPERLFEPYETSRADGTGLGLPIARTLAEANGGTLVLQGSPEGGCRAILSLPGVEQRP